MSLIYLCQGLPTYLVLLLIVHMYICTYIHIVCTYDVYFELATVMIIVHFLHVGITCANPMDTVTGKRNHQFYCGAEMVFQCEQGYRIVGSNRLLCMENGNWSNHMPICEYAPESK